MNIVELSLNEIFPYENNPRINDDAVESVANSIREFGFQQPLVLDKDHVIVVGHTRYKASQLLGLEKVPCVIADISDEKIKAYRLADNKVSELAQWDFELLDLELQDIEMDMSDFGFELDFSFDEPTEVKEAPIKEELDIPRRAKLGDVYQLGRHRVMCGDSTKKEDVDALLDSAHIHMTFQSPPYNLKSTVDGVGSKYVNPDDIDDYTSFLVDTTMNGIENSDFTFVNIQSVQGNKVELIDFMHKMKEYFADTMIWNKGFGQPAMSHQVLNSAFEYIHIFSSQKNPGRIIGTKDFWGTISNVVTIESQHKNQYASIHRATFSIEFVSFFLNNFCSKKENVMDLFGGTGTTLIACEQLDRNCYTMELEPYYVDVILDRWETLTGEKAVKL